jgi:hypothetical protein
MRSLELLPARRIGHLSSLAIRSTTQCRKLIWKVSRHSQRAGLVVELGDYGVERRVQPFDTVDGGVDEVERLKPGTSNQVRLANRIQYREIFQHRGNASTPVATVHMSRRKRLERPRVTS